MSSCITNPINYCVSQKPILLVNPSSNSLLSNIKNRVEYPRKPIVSILVRKREFLVFIELGRQKFQRSPLCCKCAERWESEENSELEGEILEFMENSSRKENFPSKKELLEAGRLDIVEAVKKRGGWLLLGWESEDEGDKIKEDKPSTVDSDIRDFQRRDERCKDSSSSVSFSPTNSSSRISSALDSSLTNQPSSLCSDNQIECDSGIEGILSRLEKERNSSFGVNLGKPAYLTHASRNNAAGCEESRPSRYLDRIDSGNQGTLASGSSEAGQLTSSNNNSSHYTRPDLWQTWSRQRAGFNGMDFEAAEILYNVKENGVPQDGKNGTVADTSEFFYGRKASNPSNIQTRLQDLEMELASALHTLKPSTAEINTKEVLGISSNNLEAVSDAMEFKENECMSAQDRLRSIRATLSVLEGKMALAIMDTEKILKQKQTRIDKASRTLQMLRTTCIFWHNSASEVFLAGSFDGWTTKIRDNLGLQRKMEKSRTGTFNVCLKLYPGKYEIKFIVDGIWKIDPLQPIVNNNGYENNLLIVS